MAWTRLLWVPLASIGLAAFASETIYYPRPESDSDPRVEYPLKLLDLALKKSGADIVLRPSITEMQQGRAIKEVETGSGLVHIVWSMTSKEREQQALPIRIPIYKGLIGWRIPLVMKRDDDLLAGVKSLEGLRSFAAGQGHDWPDTEILRANGLTVYGSPTYEGTFSMLEAGRFQYFPRSVVEIWAEADLHAAQGVVVDSHVAIHYPAAFYYFVNKNNRKLADAVTQGLEKALHDGSFDKLFHHYHDASIKRAGFENRTLIELNNPLLPAETPLGRRELWFRPK